MLQKCSFSFSILIGTYPTWYSPGIKKDGCKMIRWDPSFRHSPSVHWRVVFDGEILLVASCNFGYVPVTIIATNFLELIAGSSSTCWVEVGQIPFLVWLPQSFTVGSPSLIIWEWNFFENASCILCPLISSASLGWCERDSALGFCAVDFESSVIRNSWPDICSSGRDIWIWSSNTYSKHVWQRLCLISAFV